MPKHRLSKAALKRVREGVKRMTKGVETHYSGFVRTIEGESVGYIHFESDEKIEEDDDIIIERIVSKSLIGFEYENLEMKIKKDKKKLV